MKRCNKNLENNIDQGLELDLTPKERLNLEETLYREILKLRKRSWVPFTASFSSFEAYLRWRSRQENPQLW